MRTRTNRQNQTNQKRCGRQPILIYLDKLYLVEILKKMSQVPTGKLSTMAAPASAAVNKLFSVAGKNVLVTGGSRGFSDAGANVMITSRDENACREAVASCNNSVKFVTSNVSSREGCEELATRVGEVFNGRLDVLINNAGTSWGEPLERNSKTNWGFDKILDLNVKGIFFLTRACLPLLRRDESSSHDAVDPARIINVGSVAGMVPQEAPTHAYDVSKAAVHQLTRKFAAEFAPLGITVNCLAPGFVPSRMSSGLASWGGDAETLAQHIPLRRMGNGDDMAGACIYLSSPAGSWCTGVILNVDGGTVGAMQIPVSSL
jgi:NAD(P)-dependent dehydrogenase (short-subunit alcohol dehydrogenase family)